MVGFQFNNIHLLFKEEVVHQLLYENLTQHCVEPNHANYAIVKFLANHYFRFFIVMTLFGLISFSI